MTQDLVSLYDVYENISKEYRNVDALVDPMHDTKLTYFQLFEKIKLFASAIQSLGIGPGDKVALFSENQAKWVIADQGILAVGAADAVRGSLAPLEELNYILRHSDSKALIIESLDCFDRLYPLIEDVELSFVVYMQKGDAKDKEYKFPLYSFEEFYELGKKHNFVAADIKPYDIATLIYTSGTTGSPKGVMLSHSNIMSQIRNLHPCVYAETGTSALNVLPIWHSYERSVEYYLMSRGITMHYTNLRNFKNDLATVQPNYFISVPRIWEGFYDAIQKELKKTSAFRQALVNFFIGSAMKLYTIDKKLKNETDYSSVCPICTRLGLNIQKAFLRPINAIGDKFVYKKIRNKIMPNLLLSISGGGALARKVDDFFNAIGFNLVVGYGLTETSPVLSVRLNDNNVMYSVGPAIAETEFKIVNPETMEPVGKYVKGLVLARGPQIMQGYYKNPEATNHILLDDGWLNTGDLGWLTDSNSLVLQGRAKDTIVLSNGENIEPQGIEDACLESPYVKQIVIVGQDKPSLGAIIIPDVDACQRIIGECNSEEVIFSSIDVQKAIIQDIKTRVASRPNHRSWEQVSNVKVLKDPFSIENGLMTQSMKIKKNKVFEKYSNVIEEMYAR